MTKLEELNQIVETHNIKEVNEFLARGFRIIKILSSKSQNADREEVKPVYILGLAKT